MDIKETYLSLYFLINFSYLKEDKLFSSFIDFLKELNNTESLEKVLSEYSKFIELYKNSNSSDLFDYFKKISEKFKIIDKNNLQNEIEIIKEFLTIDFNSVKNILIQKFNLSENFINKMPEYKTGEFDIDIEKLINRFEENKRAFIFNADLEIEPIDIQDDILFKDLKGYKEQKEILYNNTKALLEGKKVNNILLYGDSGCGKSTSVRALLNEFKDLRMVQVFKDNLINLDKLYLKLKDMPYKFVIFADDISFDDTDNTFSTMKAVLEGSLIKCPSNAVVYATSNRRHLVKESFQSRKGDEIHLNDTMNEISSLSERFGINLLFLKPNMDEYLDIVLKIAYDTNLNLSEKEIIEKAKKLSIIKGSTCPRIARQLIDNLINGIEF